MTIQESYIQFLNLVNRNSTNNNVNVDQARFIMMFRDVQLRYLDWLLDNRQDDTTREAASFLVYKQPLVVKSNETSHKSFELPSNFFKFANLHVEALKGQCKSELETIETKIDDLEVVMADDLSRPSFDFRETRYFLSENDTVTVLKTDFDITKTSLTYYRTPARVDMEGYLDINGNSSVDVHPEWSDDEVNKILLAMSKEFAGINSDTNQYQLSKDRLTNFNFKQ